MGKRHELTCAAYESLDHADCDCMRSEIDRLIDENKWLRIVLADRLLELDAEPESEGNMMPEEIRDMVKNHLYKITPKPPAT